MLIMKDLIHRVTSGSIPAVVLGLLVLVVFRIPSFAEPNWYGDEGVYAAVAAEMRHGEMLYRDIWDNKPPFIYCLYLIARGDSDMVGVRLLNLLAGMAAALGIYALARQLTTERSALIAFFIAVALLGTPMFEGNIANSENFLLPFVLWGLYLGLTANGDLKRQLLSGTLFGLACLFKLIAVLDFAGLMVYMIVARTRFVRDDLGHEQIERLWPSVAGFSAPLLAISFSAILQGNFDNLMRATIFDMLQYVGGAGDHWLGLLFWPMTGTAKLLLLVLGTILIGTNFVSGKIDEREAFVATLFWFEYVAVLLSGRNYSHYLIQLVPGASLLIVVGIQRAARSTTLTGTVNLSVVLVAGLYLALIVFSRGRPIGLGFGDPEAEGRLMWGTVKAYYTNYVAHMLYGIRSNVAYQRFFNSEEPRIEILGERLISDFSDVPRDAIYVYTNQAWSYPHLGLRVPTPFCVAYHAYLAKNGTSRLMAPLEAHSPQLIVLARTVSVIPELADLLMQSYTLVEKDATYAYFTMRKPSIHFWDLPGECPTGDLKTEHSEAIEEDD